MSTATPDTVRWWRSRDGDKVHKAGCRYADPRMRWNWAQRFETAEELIANLPSWTVPAKCCFKDRPEALRLQEWPMTTTRSSVYGVLRRSNHDR